MAVVKPFRALRYDEATAGPLETLVAPPYDVISSEQREELRARSPHNVVRLTLPDSEDEAARELEEWRAQGILVEEPPAVWALEQEYVGPDGVARTRFGLVASLKVEPYETGTVLPHERTHAGPKEGRLRLLRATRVQLEPIFLLYDGKAPVERPDREPELEVDGAKLWRIDDPSVVRTSGGFGNVSVGIGQQPAPRKKPRKPGQRGGRRRCCLPMACCDEQHDEREPSDLRYFFRARTSPAVRIGS